MKSAKPKKNLHLTTILVLFVVQPFFHYANSQDIESISEQKPIKITGGASAYMSIYNSTDSVGRRSPFSYTVTGSPTLVFYGITMPFSFVYSDEQSSFSQPFNRFGVSPYYKWIKLHLGHRNVYFSPFTLAGHTFYGAGIELTPGPLRFGAISGRFRKAIAEDTLIYQDTLFYNSPLPAYKRNANAIKIGFGSEKNYVDFIYLKGRDDSTSIPYHPVNYEIYAGENAVFGISHKFILAKGITWKSDIGISAYTQDLSAEGPDTNDIPLYNTITKIITPNLSTQLLTAAESNLSYKSRYFSMQLRYRRIDPDYKSMGTYYFQTDLKQFTIAPSFILFKYKLMINSSLGFQQDNLYERKLSTSKRKIGSLNINYNASQKFGINFQYSNYGITQNPALVRNLPTSSSHRYDSMRISQVSQNIGFSPRLNFNSEKFSHAINLFIGYQELTDNNENTKDLSDMKSLNMNVNYNLFVLENKLTFAPSFIYNSSNTYYGILKSTGMSFNMGKPFWEEKIYANSNISFTKNYFNELSNGYTFNFNMNWMIKPFKSDKQSFNISMIFMKNRAENETLTRDFNEFTGSFGYNINF